MFNSYVHRARTASDSQGSGHCSPRRRDFLAQSFKSRIERQLITVPLTQTAVQMTAEERKGSPRLLLDATALRTKEWKTTLDATGGLAEKNTPIDSVTSRRHTNWWRERRQDLDLSQPISFEWKAASRRSQSVRRGKRYDKTLESLELGLHHWQESPLATTIKSRLRAEKLGQVHMKPKTDQPVVLKDDESLVSEVLKTISTPESVLLTRDQKMRLSRELMGKKPRLRGQTRGGSIATTYRSVDMRERKQLIC